MAVSPTPFLSRAPGLLSVLLASALLVSLAAPTAFVAAAPMTTRVIVRFAETVSRDAQDEILSDHRADVIARVPELHAIVVDVAGSDPAREILRLFETPGVLSADLDRTRTATGSLGPVGDDTAWALRRIGAAPVDPNGSAIVAVLDAGIDVTDASLTGRLVAGWSALGGDPFADPNGHGTALAQIIAAAPSGVAADGALVLPVQVLDEEGIGRDSDIVRGIVAATDRGADVILLGFAGPGYSSVLQAAIDYAWAAGAVLVAPVGDGGVETPLFPAGNAKVMGVAATTPIDTRWEGSDVGPAAFLAAPGQRVATSEGSMTGTSTAAALVAGSAALIAAADRDASNATIVGRLARSADPVGPRSEVGNGRIDLGAALSDRSTAGLVPLGARDGEGGPFVTTYGARTTPLAGWARDRAALSGDPITAPTDLVGTVPQLSSGSGAIAPTYSVWQWSISTGATIGGSILRQHSFLVGSTLEDPLASDHGAYTYGSVSPPAIAYGVLS